VDQLVASDSRAVARPSPYDDQPSRSPWIAQLAPDGPPRPLDADVRTDVAIVGAGIAGVATAFFVLRSTPHRVLLLERDRVARGATGRNAGQLTTYFERPLCNIADEFGVRLAAEAQRDFDDAYDLLDLLVAESGATVRVERFTGHLGMFNLQHVLVHLRSNLVRRDGGLPQETCFVSEDAEFLSDIPAELAALCTVVSQGTVRALLETRDDRYRAVLSDRKGCVNSGALVQQLLTHLLEHYPDRLHYADRTPVQRAEVTADGMRLTALGHTVTASSAVLCTNGFVDLVVLDPRGRRVELASDQRVTGRVAYMTAFVEERPRPPAAMSYIRNTTIGGDMPYVYVTRRTFDGPDGAVTLTCMGGPEHPVDGADYDLSTPVPGELLAAMDEQVRPFAQPDRAPGRPYDFQWHGLMGYNDSGIRVVGAHPHHPTLLYNLACNGVGFLPSIHGGQRVARLLAGEELAPSIFDPRE
jgi:glycine/D-amino acid oxidase-like deaminating enzyme